MRFWRLDGSSLRYYKSDKAASPKAIIHLTAFCYVEVRCRARWRRIWALAISALIEFPIRFRSCPQESLMGEQMLPNAAQGTPGKVCSVSHRSDSRLSLAGRAARAEHHARITHTVLPRNDLPFSSLPRLRQGHAPLWPRRACARGNPGLLHVLPHIKGKPQNGSLDPAPPPYVVAHPNSLLSRQDCKQWRKGLTTNLERLRRAKLDKLEAALLRVDPGVMLSGRRGRLRTRLRHRFW